jgi:hypothetical protein
MGKKSHAKIIELKSRERYSNKLKSKIHETMIHMAPRCGAEVAVIQISPKGKIDIIGTAGMSTLIDELWNGSDRILRQVSSMQQSLLQSTDIVSVLSSMTVEAKRKLTTIMIKCKSPNKRNSHPYDGGEASRPDWWPVGYPHTKPSEMTFLDSFIVDVLNVLSACELAEFMRQTSIYTGVSFNAIRGCISMMPQVDTNTSTINDDTAQRYTNL